VPTTSSSRRLNQDVSAAKRAAAEGPVIITDRGRPSHVLLTIDDYRRLTGRRVDLVDWLAMEGETIEFDPEPIRLGLLDPDLRATCWTATSSAKWEGREIKPIKVFRTGRGRRRPRPCS
jgi:prevent-host-death family protein